jgi:four helix bundle protein
LGADLTLREKLKFAKSFEELLVFQRAYKISLTIHKATKSFPADEKFGLGDQMRRASKGICANLAEGFGKNTYKAEMRRFVLMALGSCEEMRVWLRYCLDLELINHTDWEAWRDEYIAISQLLRALANSKKAGPHAIE